MIAHRDRAIISRAPKLSQNASLQQESSLEEYSVSSDLLITRCSHQMTDGFGRTQLQNFDIKQPQGRRNVRKSARPAKFRSRFKWTSTT